MCIETYYRLHFFLLCSILELSSVPEFDKSIMGTAEKVILIDCKGNSHYRLVMGLKTANKLTFIEKPDPLIFIGSNDKPGMTNQFIGRNCTIIIIRKLACHGLGIVLHEFVLDGEHDLIYNFLGLNIESHQGMAMNVSCD